MLILVSPTKTQKEAKGESQHDSLFGEESRPILKVLRSYSEEELKKRMKISDKLAQQVYENFQSFSEHNIAIHTYQGSSFKAMATESWSEIDKAYAKDHLGILSALYGIVRPFDLIGLYRLDFLNDFGFNLYDYWQAPITNYLNKQNQSILNLASQEYTRMIDTKNLRVPMIKLDFKEQSAKGYVSKSTYAKIARGTATKMIIQQRLDSIDSIKKLSFDGYSFNERLSSETEFIFTR